MPCADLDASLMTGLLIGLGLIAFEKLGTLEEKVSLASQKIRQLDSRLGIGAHVRRSGVAEVGKEVAVESIAVLSAEVGLDTALGGVHGGEEVREAANFDGKRRQRARGLGHGKRPPGDPFVNGVQIFPEMRRDLVHG